AHPPRPVARALSQPLGRRRQPSQGRRDERGPDRGAARQPRTAERLGSAALLGAYGSAAAIIVGSVVVGPAVLPLCGREGWAWLAPAVGAATILIVADVAIRLPGHADAAAVALLALALAALAVLVLRRPAGLVDFVALAIPVALLTLVIASLPFAIAGRVGILGV